MTRKCRGIARSDPGDGSSLVACGFCESAFVEEKMSVRLSRGVTGPGKADEVCQTALLLVSIDAECMNSSKRIKREKIDLVARCK